MVETYRIKKKCKHLNHNWYLSHPVTNKEKKNCSHILELVQNFTLMYLLGMDRTLQPATAEYKFPWDTQNITVQR